MVTQRIRKLDTFSLDPGVRAWLGLVSKQRQIPKSRIIDQALTEYLMRLSKENEKQQ